MALRVLKKSLGHTWKAQKEIDEVKQALRDRLDLDPDYVFYCVDCGHGCEHAIDTSEKRVHETDKYRHVANNTTREWVGLTEEEFEEILAKYNEALPLAVCRAIEARLKGKNA